MIPNTLSTAPTVRPQTKRITVNTSLSWFLWFPLAALHFRAKTNSNLPNITIAYYNITFRDTARKHLLFSFSASVFLLSHLRTTPPHTWPEMDGDRTLATWLFVGQTMQRQTNVLEWKSRENAATSIFAIIFQHNCSPWNSERESQVPSPPVKPCNSSTIKTEVAAGSVCFELQLPFFLSQSNVKRGKIYSNFFSFNLLGNVMLGWYMKAGTQTHMQ